MRQLRVNLLRFATGTLFLLVPLMAGAQSAQVADSLRLLGEYYHDNGKFREAESYYEKAFSLYEQLQDTALWLKTGLYYAEVIGYQSKYDEAFDLFYRLGEVSHPANDDSYKARIQHDMAWLFKNQGKTDRSLEHYNRGLSLAEQAGDSLMVPYLLLGAGGLYLNLDNYSKALEYRKRAIPYFEGINNIRGLAMTLNGIGTVYKNLNLLEQALEYVSRAVELRDQVDDINQVAAFYSRLGSVQQILGNYDQALIAFEKSLEYKEQTGDRLSMGVTLNNIGLLYSRLGEHEKALKYYMASLQTDKDIASPNSVATTYANVGAKLWDLERRAEAIEYYEKALALRKEAGVPRRVAQSLLNMARIERESGNYSSVLNYIKQVEEIANTTGSAKLRTDSYRWYGLIARDKERHQEALEYFRKAYREGQNLPKRGQINLLKILAQAFDDVGSDSALVYGQKAVDIVEEIRSTVMVPELKTSYFKQYSDLYINMTSWTLKYKHDPARAYRFMESAKARALTDDLLQASQYKGDQLPDTVRIQRSQKILRIEELNSKLDGQQDPEKYLTLENELRQAELDFAAFQSELQNEYPGTGRWETPTPVSLTEAQASCDANTAILEYAVTPDYLIAFLVSNSEVSARQVYLKNATVDGMPADNISAFVEDFKEAIQSHADLSELRERSSPLYGLLIEPFRQQLDSYSNLIIVPDGPLAYLPFEALDDNGSYLIQNFNIKYVPSITSLRLLREPDTNHKNQLLALAGSGSLESSATSPLVRSSPFTTLPATILEVDSVASHFSHPTRLTQDEADESELKRLLAERYRFVHLATHGVIDEEYPARSGLLITVMEKDPVSSGDDGLLRSSEIYRLNIPSEMVVLSACNSGLGKIVEGEGMLGLQRSFFNAGASTVVVSLWNVYDRSTAHLMNEFYKAILYSDAEDSAWLTRFLRWTGWNQSIPFGSKAAAMRMAKLKLIDHPRYSHPVYWAPFVVVGR